MFEKYKNLFLHYYTKFEKLTIIPRFLALAVIIIYGIAASIRDDAINLKSTEETDSISFSNQPDITPLWYRRDVLDTVYTTKESYIEVRLKEQKVYLIHRSGKIDTFLCSTGTDFVEKGQKTDPGIFLVKTRCPVLVSKQFNDTKCLNWVGFSYGIGFHALEKKNYYWSLGKRPSSHGCIRLSQESSKELFDKVSLGTPVLIRHNDHSARIIKFVSSIDMIDTVYSKRFYNTSLKEKLNNLYANRYFYKGYPKSFLTDKYIGHDGLEVGDYDKVPKTQRIPLYYHGYPNYTINSDRTSINIHPTLTENEPETDSLKTRHAGRL
jgi:hypothetical protein